MRQESSHSTVSECVRETRGVGFCFQQFGMVVVKLQAKLISSVSDDTTNKENRTFLWSTTTESVDHCVRQMVAAGWVDTTATTTKMCSSCRDDKTRQGFARRQWRSSDHKCKCCTLHRAEEDRRASTRRLKVATDDFVLPAPRPKPRMEQTQKQGTDSHRRPSRMKSGLRSGNYGRHGLPNSGWVGKDIYVKRYRVIPGAELQVHAGPGIRNEVMGYIRSKDVVTEFAATQGWGCWIRINCGLHPPEWVARIVVPIDKDGDTEEVLVALEMDAVPKDLLCSHTGCTARPSTVL